MGKTRLTEKQIVGVLNEFENGKSISELCKEHGINKAILFKWESKYRGSEDTRLKRIKEIYLMERKEHMATAKQVILVIIFLFGFVALLSDYQRESILIWKAKSFEVVIGYLLMYFSLVCIGYVLPCLHFFIRNSVQGRDSISRTEVQKSICYLFAFWFFISVIYLRHSLLAFFNHLPNSEEINSWISLANLLYFVLTLLIIIFLYGREEKRHLNNKITRMRNDKEDVRGKR